MTVILVLIFLVWFLAIDNLIIKPMFFTNKKETGTYITTPGFEMLGALAQDGGELTDAGKSKTEQARS